MGIDIDWQPDLTAWCAAYNDGGRLLPVAPADCAFDDGDLEQVRRYVARDRGDVVACGALRTHHLFAQPGRLVLDLRVRPAARRRGAGGTLLARLLQDARAAGAGIVRAYAWEDDLAWDRLAARHGFAEVERDRFLVRIVPPQPDEPALPVTDLAALGEPAERQAWELDTRLHAGLGTAAAHVPRTFARWRARTLAAPGCHPANALVTLDGADRVAGLCALRRLDADPTTAYHLFTGVDPSARGQGHARALKQGAAAWAARNGVQRLVADTSPANGAMLQINLAAGYRAVGDARNLEARV